MHYLLSIYFNNWLLNVSSRITAHLQEVDCVWNVMAHTQKPGFVFRLKGRVRLKRRGRYFIRLLAAEVCASAVVMLNTPCYEVVWKVLTTHSIRQFPLHFPFRALPCAITFQLDSTTLYIQQLVYVMRFCCLTVGRIVMDHDPSNSQKLVEVN
jgi:hypothetical protein